MRKVYKIIIAAVVVIWIFASGLVLGTYTVRNRVRKSLNESTAPVTQATQPSTTVPTTQGIIIDMITDVSPQTEAPTTQPFSIEITTSGGNITTFVSNTEKTLNVPSGNKEIADALVSAVNSTKATKAFTAVRRDQTDFVIDNVTGGSAVKGIAESVINKVGNRPETTYSFSNGKDNNGSSETPVGIIAPANKSASISETAIKSASAQTNADGGYDITLTLNDETQTLSQKATNHDGLFDTPDMTSLPLPSGIKMGRIDFVYSNATINASVNSDGRLTSISYSLPISQGIVEGSMLSATVNISLHGVYSSTTRFTY